MVDLGEKLYERFFTTWITSPNDENCHVNNKDYPIYSEGARQSFLEFFGWGDSFFRQQKGVAMIMRGREITYRKPMFKGQEIEIKLELFFKKNPLYHMIYTFYDANKENILVVDKTRCVFVSVPEEKVIDVPDFFINALRSNPKT